MLKIPDDVVDTIISTFQEYKTSKKQVSDLNNIYVIAVCFLKELGCDVIRGRMLNDVENMTGYPAQIQDYKTSGSYIYPHDVKWSRYDTGLEADCSELFVIPNTSHITDSEIPNSAKLFGYRDIYISVTAALDSTDNMYKAIVTSPYKQGEVISSRSCLLDVVADANDWICNTYASRFEYFKELDRRYAEQNDVESVKDV